MGALLLSNFLVSSKLEMGKGVAWVVVRVERVQGINASVKLNQSIKLRIKVRKRTGDTSKGDRDGEFSLTVLENTDSQRELCPSHSQAHEVMLPATQSLRRSRSWAAVLSTGTGPSRSSTANSTDQTALLS